MYLTLVDGLFFELFGASTTSCFIHQSGGYAFSKGCHPSRVLRLFGHFGRAAHDSLRRILDDTFWKRTRCGFTFGDGRERVTKSTLRSCQGTHYTRPLGGLSVWFHGNRHQLRRASERDACFSLQRNRHLYYSRFRRCRYCR